MADNFVYAIIDVKVSDHGSPGDDYTGVSWREVTSPYFKDKTGVRIEATDVNEGIGGATTTIWVKYALVLADSTQPILTDIAVTHWPDWKPRSPDNQLLPNSDSVSSSGWQRAGGTSSGIGGALTTKTKGACWRNGLCVRYKPINTCETFIGNLFLSRSTNGTPSYPRQVQANNCFWPMSVGGLDIHCECGDDLWFHLCYSTAKLVPVSHGPRPTYSDKDKMDMITKYAPFVYMAPGEKYFPSSVEWALTSDNFIRYKKGNNYWIRTKATLDSPSDVLPFFSGNMAEAKIYAFWVEKNYDITEITYFIYYPYNRGKEILSTVWGNHVGDWEHVTIRMMWSYTENAGWQYGPAEIYGSAHEDGSSLLWNEIGKTVGKEQPIVFSAWGSHAFYFHAGSFKYKSIPLVGDLVDTTGKGEGWDTSGAIVAFDYKTKTGLNGKAWPVWMGDNFSEQGQDPTNPLGGPIYRWGNEKDGCLPKDVVCRLENGPTGPVSKSDVWNPEKFE